ARGPQRHGLVEPRASRVDQAQAEGGEDLVRPAQGDRDGRAENARGRREAQLARPRLPSENLVHLEAALVVVVGNHAVVGRDGDPERDKAADDRDHGPGYQEPDPGLAVPGARGLHVYLTRNTERSRTRTPGSSTAPISN